MHTLPEIVITALHTDEEVGAFTSVYRFEFETEEQMLRVITAIEEVALDGGQMVNREKA